MSQAPKKFNDYKKSTVAERANTEFDRYIRDDSGC